MVWWAYDEGRITKLALRAYFGAIELEVRRRLSGGKYQPSMGELRKLVGGPETGRGGLRPALKQLLELGLLKSCAKTGIVFAESPDELRLEDASGLDAMLAKFQGVRRKVPVPRRMIRRLAGGLSKARTATVLAHLIRCLFYRKGEGVNPVGCCKASWIADAFGVTERSVFDARKFLILDLGWLLAGECSQRVLNRDGLWVSVNLDWGAEEQGAAAELSPAEAVAAPVAADESSGPRPGNAGHFSGPSTDKKPLRESNNQKPASRPPASGGPAGFQSSNSGEKKPTLRDIAPEDLRDTERLIELHGQAVERGLVTSSEADRLRFFAAATHARSVGSNPPRLFAWMLGKGRFDFITQADEDDAQSRLKAFARASSGLPQETPRSTPPALSRDALFVREILPTLRARGIHADPFAAVSRHLSEWTRERWDAAIAELDRPKPRDVQPSFSALGTILGGVVAGEAELRNRY